MYILEPATIETSKKLSTQSSTSMSISLYAMFHLIRADNHDFFDLQLGTGILLEWSTQVSVLILDSRSKVQLAILSGKPDGQCQISDTPNASHTFF